MTQNASIIVLAAGLGTRMHSDKAKVLHEICGRPMIQYVIEAAMQVVGHNVIVVVGHQSEMVREALSEYRGISFALQEFQLGTGHAVLSALPYLSPDVDDVVVLCGDVPLIYPHTIRDLLQDHQKNQRDVTLLGIHMPDPKGYGRILFDDSGHLAGIVEEADVDAQQRDIQYVNTGIYAIKRSFLANVLPQIKPTNKQGEIYLTDIIGIGYQMQRSLGLTLKAKIEEVVGVNTRSDLESVENIMKIRIK